MLGMALPVPHTPLPLRRNGKLQSCSPCQKAKCACDHSLPKCGRCIRRGLISQCTYHPSPTTCTLTNEQLVHAARIQKNRSTPAKTASNLSFLVSQCSPNFKELSASSPAEFHGPTSYSAVFRENQAHIGEDILKIHQGDESGHDAFEPLLDSEQNQWNKSERLSLAISVLKNFPHQPLSERLMNRFFELCYIEYFHEGTVKFALRSLWTEYGKYLTQPMEAKLLSIMAEKMLQNELTALPSCHSTKEWLESFTGPKIRWEILGTFFACFGLSVMTMSDWDPMFPYDAADQKRDKRQYAQKLGECAEACLAICDDIGASNEFAVWLTFQIHTLQFVYSGDDSRRLWKRHGNIAGAITALGLHRGSDIGNSPSFMVSELRKRIFCSAFASDKLLATFAGRPPALSRRYCNCQMPLDLTDEQLEAEGEELAQILGRLDVNGWNTDGVISRASVARAWMLMSLVRDEILELSLGPATEISSSRRDELKRRSEEIYAQIPSQLHCQIDGSRPFDSPSDFLLQNTLYLDFILNQFLLDRLPIFNGSQKTTQTLLNTSKQQLDQVIFFYENRDRVAEFETTPPCVIVHFGVPAAGVLGIELLKQFKYPQQYTLTLPRSEIIQKLCIFVGYLGGVRRSQGNYTLCVRMKKVIKRILDQILEQPPLPVPELTPPTVQEDLAGIDFSSIMGPADDPEFSEWLSSVDWTKGPWVDSN